MVLKQRNGKPVTWENQTVTDWVLPPPPKDSARPGYFPIHNNDVWTYSKYSISWTSLSTTSFLDRENIETLEIRFDSVALTESSEVFRKTITRQGIHIETEEHNEGRDIWSKDTTDLPPTQVSFMDTVSFFFGPYAKMDTLTLDGKVANVLRNSQNALQYESTFFPEGRSSQSAKQTEWSAISVEGVGLTEATVDGANYLLRSRNGTAIQYSRTILGLQMGSRLPEIPHLSIIRHDVQSENPVSPAPFKRTYDLLGRWLPEKPEGYPATSNTIS